jgi:hypothetical protein
MKKLVDLGCFEDKTVFNADAVRFVHQVKVDGYDSPVTFVSFAPGHYLFIASDTMPFDEVIRRIEEARG